MSAEAPAALKEMFNAARYRQIARLLSKIHPEFNSRRFLALTGDGHEQLSLLQRMRRTAEACQATLPPDFPEAVAILKRLAPQIEHGFVSIFLSDFVGLYGQSHFKESMAALKYFTRFGSAEYAIREFLKRDLERTLKVMAEWSLDQDEHVRRLASEGSRPRLPWSFRLEAILRNPALTQPILENLKGDPSLYVRKSVANHLNDISKDHPDLMLGWLNRWDLTDPHTRWIARQASRSLIKAAHPGSFRLFGFTKTPAVAFTRFSVAPSELKLGDQLNVAFTLTSASPKPQKLAIDYILHYRKKSGQLSPKVFKLKEVALPPRASIVVSKRQRITNFTTRVHYAGNHEVEIMVNGRILGRGRFNLSL